MSNKNEQAKFAFFYMLSLVALVFMALSTGTIIFQIINKYVIDAYNEHQGRYIPEALKFAISAIIISAPIYYLTTKQIMKNLREGHLEKDSGIRKWLTYFILFVSAVVMIGWLIGTINGFLDGELTMKFALKSLTSIGISGMIFGFYFYDIKREDVKKKDKVICGFTALSLLIILSAFVASLFMVESPKQTRNRRIDRDILNAFSRLDSEINSYYQEFKELPEDLDDLKKERVYLDKEDMTDPETGKMYEYKIVEDKKYELCAEFRTSNKDPEEAKMYIYHNREHDAGYHCLNYKAYEDSEDRLKRGIDF